jgi:hypothetical protein
MEHNPISETINQRKSTRFIRKDIKVSIVKPIILGLKEKINCKLVDISSTGIQISTSVKLGTATKLTVNLSFETGKIFKLKSRIKNHHETNHYLSVHSFPKIKTLLNDNEISLDRLCLYQSNNQISAKFRNLHSSSVKVLTLTPLNPEERYNLIFILNNGKKHKAWTKIDDYQHHKYYNYGIKFDKVSDKLGEYLLETQTDLVFK